MAKKIVVIDDEPNITKLLQAFLERKGYQIFLAYDGMSGYELVEKETPHLVITDLLLPRLHGFEVCKKVKENPKLAHIPVILMTAIYKKTRYKLEGKGYGADDFIEKPFELPTLLSKIEKLILSPIRQNPG